MTQEAFTEFDAVLRNSQHYLTINHEDFGKLLIYPPLEHRRFIINQRTVQFHGINNSEISYYIIVTSLNGNDYLLNFTNEADYLKQRNIVISFLESVIDKEGN
jgi:hypothetical protein